MTERQEVKSQLQESLESGGWKYLGNTFPFDDASLRGGDHTRREFPILDEEIKNEFLGRGFSQVMVTDAYSIEAIYLPQHRAVYVRGEKKSF